MPGTARITKPLTKSSMRCTRQPAGGGAGCEHARCTQYTPPSSALYHTRRAYTYSRCAMGGGKRERAYTNADCACAAVFNAGSGMSSRHGGGSGCSATHESSQSRLAWQLEKWNATIWSVVQRSYTARAFRVLLHHAQPASGVRALVVRLTIQAGAAAGSPHRQRAGLHADGQLRARLSQHHAKLQQVLLRHHVAYLCHGWLRGVIRQAVHRQVTVVYKLLARLLVGCLGSHRRRIRAHVRHNRHAQIRGATCVMEVLARRDAGHRWHTAAL
eukprot:363169-Chlamydomonas_euryale.AAC.19